MRSDDAERVLQVISSIFSLDSVPESYVAKLRSSLLDLELATRNEPKIDWITEARSVAITIAEERGTVSIVDVLDECPLPESIDPRVVGGVFKHQRFNRVNSITIKNDNGRYKTVGVFSLQNVH